MAEETISNQLRLFRFVSYGVDLISLNIRNESKTCLTTIPGADLLVESPSTTRRVASNEKP
jgi:hypothetical protein